MTISLCSEREKEKKLNHQKNGHLSLPVKCLRNTMLIPNKIMSAPMVICNLLVNIGPFHSICVSLNSCKLRWSCVIRWLCELEF